MLQTADADAKMAEVTTTAVCHLVFGSSCFCAAAADAATDLAVAADSAMTVVSGSSCFCAAAADAAADLAAAAVDANI